MRTTVTLDPDVVRLLKAEVHRARKPFKQIVNDALRRGLSAPGASRPKGRYRVHPHAARLRPGIDAGRLNALADEMDDAVIVSRTGRR